MVSVIAENLIPTFHSLSNSPRRSSHRDIVQLSTLLPLPFRAFVYKRRFPPFVTFPTDNVIYSLRINRDGHSSVSRRRSSHIRIARMKFAGWLLLKLWGNWEMALLWISFSVSEPGTSVSIYRAILDLWWSEMTTCAACLCFTLCKWARVLFRILHSFSIFIVDRKRCVRWLRRFSWTLR